MLNMNFIFIVNIVLFIIYYLRQRGSLLFVSCILICIIIINVSVIITTSSIVIFSIGLLVLLFLWLPLLSKVGSIFALVSWLISSLLVLLLLYYYPHYRSYHYHHHIYRNINSLNCLSNFSFKNSFYFPTFPDTLKKETS